LGSGLNAEFSGKRGEYVLSGSDPLAADVHSAPV
jgi:hypothetical protein